MISFMFKRKTMKSRWLDQGPRVKTTQCLHRWAWRFTFCPTWDLKPSRVPHPSTPPPPTPGLCSVAIASEVADFHSRHVYFRLIVSRSKHRHLVFWVSIEETVPPLELAMCAVAAAHSSSRQKVDVTFMEGAWGRRTAAGLGKVTGCW